MGTRELILARRRRFLAMAVATVGLASAGSACEPAPMPCLSPIPNPPTPDAGVGSQLEATATPCLAPPRDRGMTPAGPGGVTIDGGGANEGDAGIDDTDDTDASSAAQSASGGPATPPPLPASTTKKGPKVIPCLQPPRDRDLERF